MTRWYDEVFENRVRFGLATRRVLHSEQSAFQKIEILETEAFGRVLALDGVFMTSERDEYFYHEMLVHPALTTAPAIRRVLVIGGGDGGTVREVLRHPEVEQVVLVEIDRRVVEVCRNHLPSIGRAWDDPRLELRFEDGVSYAREADDPPYDVILVDGGDPVGPARGLFDPSFYRGCRRLLARRGVLALQSESPFLTRDTFLAALRNLREVLGSARPYFGPAPLYAAGLWSWTYVSPTVDPQQIIEARVATAESGSRYYNREIHRAAFALPAEIARALGIR